jgi:hypothetical protein
VLDRTGEAEDDVVHRVMGEESRRRFDLANGPLVVTHLVRLSGGPPNSTRNPTGSA